MLKHQVPDLGRRHFPRHRKLRLKGVNQRRVEAFLLAKSVLEAKCVPLSTLSLLSFDLRITHSVFHRLREKVAEILESRA